MSAISRVIQPAEDPWGRGQGFFTFCSQHIFVSPPHFSNCSLCPWVPACAAIPRHRAMPLSATGNFEYTSHHHFTHTHTHTHPQHTHTHTCPTQTHPQRTRAELKQLFLRALRMVRVVAHVCLAIRSDRHEERRREMTMEEMHYYSMDDQKFSSDVMTLHYNKAEFAASNQVSETRSVTCKPSPPPLPTPSPSPPPPPLPAGVHAKVGTQYDATSS